jgi:hypothetical protein
MRLGLQKEDINERAGFYYRRHKRIKQDNGSLMRKILCIFYNFHLFSVTTGDILNKVYFLYKENKKYISNSKSVYKEKDMSVTYE